MDENTWKSLYSLTKANLQLDEPGVNVSIDWPNRAHVTGSSGNYQFMLNQTLQKQEAPVSS